MLKKFLTHKKGKTFLSLFDSEMKEEKFFKSSKQTR